MNQQPAIRSGSNPPWLFIGGIVLGGLLIAFMLWDSFSAPAKSSGNANVIELTSENWEREVVNSTVPVMVDFWAPWCGPCRTLAPTIDKLADRYEGKVKVCKLNVDKAQDIAANYNISGIPCVLLFAGGKQPVDRFTGVQPESTFAKAIDKVLAKR